MEKNKANEVEVSATSDKGQSNPESLSISIFFQKDSYCLYVHKKTEKMVSAIYLLTSLFGDLEPLKTKLRSEGLSLLSKSLFSPNHSVSLRAQITSEFLLSATEIISLLEVAKISRLISNMNYEVIISEFNSLLKVIDENRTPSNSSTLSSNFFVTEGYVPIKQDSPFNHSQTNLLKEKTSQIAHDFVKDKESVNVLDKVSKTKLVKTFEKPNRSEKILTLMKKDRPMTIKDFAVSIRDCSEKTLQRELLSLVSKGLIKKEGERRWSKYSLI